MATSKKTSSRKPAAARPARTSHEQVDARKRQLDEAIAHGVASFMRGMGGIDTQIAAPPPRHPYPEPPAPAPERSSMLLDALHSLGRRVDEAYAALEGLERAASLVLVPEPTSPAGDSCGSTAMLVTQAPAIDMLQGLADRVERLMMRMTVVTGRVQA